MGSKVKLPEPKFYTLSTLAEKLGCSIETVINYLKTGQLSASVESNNWPIEKGFIEVDENGWFKIPDTCKKSKRETFTLIENEVKALLQNGYIENPDFVSEEGKYVCVSTRYDDTNIIIKTEDLIFLERDIEKLISLREIESLKEEIAPSKQTRKSEIHECIGKAIKSLIRVSNQKPSAEDVWKYIYKNKDKSDDFTCITEIAICTKTKEKAILWTSQRGFSQSLSFSSFSNIVSDFNTGKKELPED